MIEKIIALILCLGFLSFLFGLKIGYDINEKPNYKCKNTMLDFKNGEYCCFQDDCYFKYPVTDLGIFRITNNINITF